MMTNGLRLDTQKSPTARLCRNVRCSSGFATVEFAMTLPLLALAMSLGLWLSSLGLAQIQLQSGATTAARILARGEVLPVSFTNQLPRGAVLDSTFTTESVTVLLSLDKRTPLSRIPMAVKLKARSVANLEENQSIFNNQE